ncbi:MAG: glycoside hydrolase family 18 [Prevotella sp.]|jgi:hypothetical protein|nr:glycoside hydrolase family 18 [Prevotella sp.]
MKIDIRKAFYIALAVGAIFVGCNKWTEAEAIDLGKTDLNGTNKTDEYYASLREWKNTPGLPQTFVWFDNWNGVSPTGENSLRGLPDSVTIASNWGGHPKFDLSPERKADMEYVQKVKGTKVVVTLFSSHVGDDMPDDPIYNVGSSSDEAVVRPAIRRYAEAIYDAVVATGYDGFDWDYEPTVCGCTGAYLWQNVVQRRIFVEELSYWFGKGASDPNRDRGGRKAAKQGLLFLIDGEVGSPNTMGEDWLTYYVDYFVHQAYGSVTTSSLTNRVNGTINKMTNWINQGFITKEEIVRRCIVTENFESYASSGGGLLVQSSFVYVGTGAHAGVVQQIGGFGIYRPTFDYDQGKGDYNGSPEYYFLRQGITNLYRIYNELKKAAE